MARKAVLAAIVLIGLSGAAAAETTRLPLRGFGAHRPFDVQAPDRVYFGHNLRYDAKAAADALVRIRQFLEQHLRP